MIILTIRRHSEPSRNASLAAFTARSISFYLNDIRKKKNFENILLTSPPSATSVITSPVAGLITSNVFPLAASTNSLLIKSYKLLKNEKKSLNICFF